MISRFYFILYEVDSPIMLRYKRFKEKYKKHSDFTLEDFVELDDKVSCLWLCNHLCLIDKFQQKGIFNIQEWWIALETHKEKIP